MSRTIDDARAFLAEMTDELNGAKLLDPLEMFRVLTDRGKEMADLPPEERTEENFVHGCVSNVYIAAELKDGAVWYRGSADAHVVRGYVAVIIEALSGLAPEEIVESSREAVDAFVRETELKASLTPNRANAFGNIYALMVEHARNLAQAAG